jgi:hypothetical protein
MATPSLRLELLKSTLAHWKFLRFFTDEVDVKAPKLLQLEEDSSLWGNRGKERSELQSLVRALSRVDEQDRKLLLSIAQGMARRGAKR